MKLSKNFKLSEFLISEVAARHDIDMTPSEAVIENIQTLVTTCLQPLRNKLDETIFITSGFRPLELNTIIGGSATSAHLSGSAADFVSAGSTPLYICRVARDLGLPYDQVIHEFGQWVHLGISRSRRGQELTAYRRDGATRYVFELSEIEGLLA